MSDRDHRNAVSLFESRKGNLDERVRDDYLKNGIVTIPCNVSDYGDVISTYSVKGFETLNPEFVDYVTDAAELTPPECPIVLDIISDCLSPEEQAAIELTIRDDFAYDLGKVEREERRHTRIFCFMIVLLAVFGVALWLTEAGAEVPREVLFILFWFAGDTLADYILLTGHDLRRDRRLAGRLASVKVVFSKSYEKRQYTQEDVSRLYSEIRRDVNDSKRRD